MRAALPLGLLFLSSCASPTEEAAYDRVAASDGAQFRSIAEGVYRKLSDPCVPQGSQDAFQAAQSRISNLDARLAGSPRGIDLAIAAADVALARSVENISCSQSDDEAGYYTDIAESAMDEIIRLETMAAHMTAGEAG